MLALNFRKCYVGPQKYISMHSLHMKLQMVLLHVREYGDWWTHVVGIWLLLFLHAETILGLHHLCIKDGLSCEDRLGGRQLKTRNEVSTATDTPPISVKIKNIFLSYVCFTDFGGASIFSGPITDTWKSALIVEEGVGWMPQQKVNTCSVGSLIIMVCWTSNLIAFDVFSIGSQIKVVDSFHSHKY